MPSAPSKTEKKLVRLISALVDMRSACAAHDRLRGLEDVELREILATHFVVAYWRPFTENYGVGRIQCDYPDYPVNEPSDIKSAHGVLDQMRNKFCAHSSAEGFKVFIVPKGGKDPNDDQISDSPTWSMGRRSFADIGLLDTLRSAVDHFAMKLIRDINSILSQSYNDPSFTVPLELKTCYDEFQSQFQATG